MNIVVIDEKANSIVLKEFELLKAHIGKHVIATIVKKDETFKRQGLLEFLDEYLYIGIEGVHSALIGMYESISKIETQDGIILYENTHIDYSNAPKISDKDEIRKSKEYMNSVRRMKYGTDSCKVN